MDTNENLGWIVRSGDSYLCPQDGDVGYTSNLNEAGRFGSEEEAREAGRDHCDPGFVVMPFPSIDDRLRESVKALEEYVLEEHDVPVGIKTNQPQQDALPPASASPTRQPAGPISFLAFSKASRHLKK